MCPFQASSVSPNLPRSRVPPHTPLVSTLTVSFLLPLMARLAAHTQITCHAGLPSHPQAHSPPQAPAKHGPRGEWLSRIRTAAPQPGSTQEPLLGLSEPDHPGRILVRESQYWKTPPSPVAATPAPQLPAPTPSQVCWRPWPTCVQRQSGQSSHAVTTHALDTYWCAEAGAGSAAVTRDARSLPVPTGYGSQDGKDVCQPAIPGTLSCPERQCIPSNVCLDRWLDLGLSQDHAH